MNGIVARMVGDGNFCHFWVAAFAGRCHFVPGALGDNLSLELGEGEKDVERESPHGVGCVELLGDTHKRATLGVKPSPDLAKIQ